MQKLAFGVSVIFHPVFLFFYVLILTIVLMPGRMAGGDWFPMLVLTGFVFLNTIVFPLIGTYLLTGGVMLHGRTKRTGAYLITSFFYVLSYFFLLQTPVFEFLKAYNLSIVAVLITLTMLNMRWKISMHTAGMGGLLALISHMYYQMPHLFFYPMLITVIIAGLVGSARLKLDAHTNTQIYIGYIAGFTITGILMGMYLS